MKALLYLSVLLVVVQSPSRGRELLIVHSDDMGQDTLDAFRSLWRFRNVRFVGASRASTEDVSGERVALIGTARSNKWIRDLTPAKLEEHGFHYAGAFYGEPHDVLHARFPNPLDTRHTLSVVMANSSEGLTAIRRSRADVHIRRNERTVYLGFRDGQGDRRFDLATEPELQTDHFRYFNDTGGALEIDGFAAANEALVTTLGATPARQDVHLYANLEEKGLITDDTRSAHADPRGIHVVLGVNDEPSRRIAQALLPERESLLIQRGHAILCTASEAEIARLEQTAARLLRTSDPPSPTALVDNDVFTETSPFVTDAVGASFVRYGNETAWRAALSKADAAKPRPDPIRGFQHGFTYAHEGYQIHNGYLSARSDASLEKLASLGVDAVAVVPYAFVREPTKTIRLDVPTRAGSETDEDVIHVVRKAQALGLNVLLKPQIWVRGGWPGDIEPLGAGADAAFFREYGRWIRHYALMAEAQQVPLLAIGTELAKMTDGRRTWWKTLIEDVRAVYGGKLVYAANWGKEVQQVEFWDLVDYIGVDFYYPLSFEASPTDQELRAGFRAGLDQVRQLHEKHDKPVLLTEIGYASTKSPWQKPHASDRVDVVSVDDQARAYEIAFSVIERETPWVRGMYWWKWPSHSGRGGPEHRGFTPHGKPASEVVRRFYRARLQ